VYSLAFSVLKSLEIPATIFLTGVHVKERKAPWIAQLHSIFDYVFLKRIIDAPKNASTTLRPKIFKLLMGIKSFLKRKNIEDIDCFLKMLKNSFQCDLSQDIILNKFLDDHEINQLTSHGWTIGNHTYNHVNLNCLSEKSVKDEIVLTRRALENFKQYRDVLAIPFGVPSSYSDSVIETARENGISHIFTTRGGINAVDGRVTLLDRVICETLSFNYFKFLASGKKRYLEDILKKFQHH
jgi:peptidoglycan/xylan/chitin deacetylase (PgdA/CDA1 family)